MTRGKLVITATAFFISFFATSGIIYAATIPTIISPLADLLTSNTPLVITASPSPTMFSTPSPTLQPSASPTPILKPTPTPILLPSVTPVTGTQLDEWFTNYANKEQVDREMLRKIALCESKFNPAARNGPYGGMYQFTESLWRNTRTVMSENADPNLRYNAEESIKTAAYKIRHSGTGAWPSCD